MLCERSGPKWFIRLAERCPSRSDRTLLSHQARGTRFEAAVAGARAQVEEARLTAEGERSATDAVRAEVAQHVATIIAKDGEIERLAAALSGRDHTLTERAAELDRLTSRIEQERAGRAE